MKVQKKHKSNVVYKEIPTEGYWFLRIYNTKTSNFCCLGAE
jgi:hypothetical protein